MSDVATTLHYGCRLISDWLYIPIRFQHSEEDHTHNAQQERKEGKLSVAHQTVILSNSVISINKTTDEHRVLHLNAAHLSSARLGEY